MKLIDKDALVAKIERFRKTNKVSEGKEYAQYELDVKCGYDMALDDMLSYINSLSEEPVSIWHDASEIPQEGSLILREIGISQKGYGVIRYSKELPSFPKRCEDIPIQKWAYIDDILNLSNVERTTKNWKEPVSEDLEEAAWFYADRKACLDKSVFTQKEVNEKRSKLEYNWEDIRIAFKTGVQWKTKQMMTNAINAQCFGFQGAALFSFRLPASNYLVGSEVKVVIIKEE